MTTDPSVLYIAGMSRSGTTIAGRILGTIPGWTFAGEVRRTWHPGLAADRLCGCGRTHEDCPVWSRILEPGRRFMGHLPSEIARMAAAAASVEHSSRSALRIRTRGVPPDADASRYLEVLAELYRRFADVTGARVIVDTSKNPGDALLLRHLPLDRAAVIHVVRDPRGVTHSHLRREPVAGVARSAWLALGWSLRGAMCGMVVRRFGSAGASYRYEDVVRDPDAFARLACRLVRFRAPDAPMAPGGDIDLPDGHAASGNAVRQRGTVALVEDRSWVEELRPVDRRVVTALTLPSLLRWGYPLSPQVPPAAARGAFRSR